MSQSEMAWDDAREAEMPPCPPDKGWQRSKMRDGGKNRSRKALLGQILVNPAHVAHGGRRHHHAGDAETAPHRNLTVAEGMLDAAHRCFYGSAADWRTRRGTLCDGDDVAPGRPPPG